MMSARGILRNPALFAGYDEAPWECYNNFIKYSLEYGSSFTTVHRHICFMLSSVSSKYDMLEFENLNSISGIKDFFVDRGFTFN
jgi:tRNA-dihydrouridine synthase 4